MRPGGQLLHHLSAGWPEIKAVCSVWSVCRVRISKWKGKWLPCHGWESTGELPHEKENSSWLPPGGGLQVCGLQEHFLREVETKTYETPTVVQVTLLQCCCTCWSLTGVCWFRLATLTKWEQLLWDVTDLFRQEKDTVQAGPVALPVIIQVSTHAPASCREHSPVLPQNTGTQNSDNHRYDAACFCLLLLRTDQMDPRACP